MNGPKYVELLMEDGTSCHRSEVAIEFLKKNKISVLELLRSQSNREPVDCEFEG